MGTTVEKLQKALDNKAGIKRALDARRFKDVGENQSTWESEIYAIEPPYDMLVIKDNGKHNVADYKNIDVGIVAQGDEALIDLIEGDSETFTIPYGTKTIRQYCFYECVNIQEITIPEGITSIGNRAFSNCRALTNIEIPSSVTSIGEYGFASCTSLKNITIPDSVTTIGKYTFNAASALESIYLPKNITILEERLFSNCRALTNIEIPSSVTTLGNYIFNGCSALESIEIPDSVTTYGNYIFDSCYSLKNVKLPNNIQTIPPYMFNNCRTLESIEIPESVTTIGMDAFQFCYELKNITIPNSVTKIDSYAFQCCYMLTELTIPSSVTNIGQYALRIGTETNKTTIIMERETPPTLGSKAIDTAWLDKIFVKQGCRNKYITATNWSTYADYIVERNSVIVNVPYALLNNENYTYSLDNGVTYNQFTQPNIALENVALIKMKSTTTDNTILIGTTEGGNDIGTIANSELTFSFNGDTTIYLTIQ